MISLQLKRGENMTKEEIGLVLKRLRISCGLTEVAEKIGRKQQIVGHWETGYAQPDANTLFTLCDIYGVTVDDAFGFQKKTDISILEYERIKKYRDLDHHGKKMVDFTLNEEWERSQELKNDIKVESTEFSAEIVPIKEHLIPNAAHHRTDIDTSDIPEDADDKYFDE